jgi:hypothetical protein
MVAWRTGPGGTLPVQARILAADGSVQRVAVRLRMPFVRSVLPADSANLQPKPPRDVYGVERDWRALLMIAGGLLVALAALLYYFLVLRKRRPKRRAVPPDARAAALAALERARASGLAERDVHAFYAEVSGALRRFAAAVDGGWSPHLTTTELIARMRERGVAPGEVEPLGRVLQTADLAKFARWPVGAEVAARDWGAARAWVQGFGVKSANGGAREGGR